MTILNEIDSKKLLESIGIPIPKGYFVPIDDLTDGTYRAASFIGNTHYVIKVVSPNISHKSDIGGVMINVQIEDLFVAVHQVIKNITKHQPNAKIDGIYIEEMIKIKDSIELLIGIKNDSQFGHIIVVGSGGIFTEVYRDTSMRVLPITKFDIIEMLNETKIYKILSGYRSKVYDIESLIDAIMKISILAEQKGIQELDINPIVVYDRGIKALDARILL